MEIANLKTTDFPDTTTGLGGALAFASEMLGRTPEDILAEATREPLSPDEIESLIHLRVDMLVEEREV